MENELLNYGGAVSAAGLLLFLINVGVFMTKSEAYEKFALKSDLEADFKEMKEHLRRMNEKLEKLIERGLK